MKYLLPIAHLLFALPASASFSNGREKELIFSPSITSER